YFFGTLYNLSCTYFISVAIFDIAVMSSTCLIASLPVGSDVPPCALGITLSIPPCATPTLAYSFLCLNLLFGYVYCFWFFWGPFFFCSVFFPPYHHLPCLSCFPFFFCY